MKDQISKLLKLGLPIIIFVVLALLFGIGLLIVKLAPYLCAIACCYIVFVVPAQIRSTLEDRKHSREKRKEQKPWEVVNIPNHVK